MRTSCAEGDAAALLEARGQRSLAASWQQQQQYCSVRAAHTWSSTSGSPGAACPSAAEQPALSRLCCPVAAPSYGDMLPRQTQSSKLVDKNCTIWCRRHACSAIYVLLFSRREIRQSLSLFRGLVDLPLRGTAAQHACTCSPAGDTKWCQGAAVVWARSIYPVVC